MCGSKDSSEAPLPDITILNPDLLLGADSEGNLYDGTRIRLGWDELEVTTTLAEDGLSFERTTGHGDSLISKSTVTKDGFLASPRWAEVDEAEQDAAWQAECAISANGKVFVDAFVDGQFTVVEKTIEFTDWTAR